MKHTVFRVLLTHPLELALQLSITSTGKLVVFRSSAAVRFRTMSEAQLYAMYVSQLPHILRRGLDVKAVECSIKLPGPTPGLKKVKEPDSKRQEIEEEIFPKSKATWLSGLL